MPVNFSSFRRAGSKDMSGNVPKPAGQDPPDNIEIDDNVVVRK
jgi:hypothetical protein